jgi:hypothetical protein
MITDWKGNEIKEGMEVCCIRTKRRINIYIPKNVPLGPYYEDCWEIDPPMTVGTVDSQLGIISKIGAFFPFDLMAPMDEHFLLAIKGVSDVNPNI